MENLKFLKQIAGINEPKQEPEKEANDDIKCLLDRIEKYEDEVEKLSEKLKKSEQENETLKQEKKTLISITESNKAKAKERVQQLKQTIRLNIDSHNSEIKQVEEERQKFIATIEELKLKLQNQIDENKRLKKEMAQSQVDVDTNNKKLNDTRVELETLRSVKQQNDELSEEIRTLRLDMTMNQQLLANECSQTERLKEVIQEKDQTISKLKETVQFYSKQEQSNKKTIDDLKSDLCKLTEAYAQISANSSQSTNQDDIVTKLQLEKAQLEKKLKNSQASADLIAKNRQLSAMMEKSNRLYTMLLDEHQALVKEHESMKPKYVHRDMVFVTGIESTTIKAAPIKMIEKTNDTNDVTIAYLRRTLLQFFTEEQNDRNSMIPLILDLVGCTKEQILVATKEYQKSQQLISRTSRFFFR